MNIECRSFLRTRFLFIRTSKFWPRLVVLEFLHNLSLGCSFKNLRISLVSVVFPYSTNLF